MSKLKVTVSLTVRRSLLSFNPQCRKVFLTPEGVRGTKVSSLHNCFRIFNLVRYVAAGYNWSVTHCFYEKYFFKSENDV